jgi:hypothetical protein
VYGVNSDGSIYDRPPSSADGRTRAFEPTFDETAAFIGDAAAPGPAYTLVQRIGADALKLISHTPVQVRITLYASSVGAAVIHGISISAPSSAPGAKPYDSAADLTTVPLPNTPLVVPANTHVALPVTLGGVDRGVDYIVLPKFRPLLIAVNLSASSAVRQTGPVPANIAVAYRRLGAEAVLQTRSPGYTALPRVLLIGKIEIG